MNDDSEKGGKDHKLTSVINYFSRDEVIIFLEKLKLTIEGDANAPWQGNEFEFSKDLASDDLFITLKNNGGGDHRTSLRTLFRTEILHGFGLIAIKYKYISESNVVHELTMTIVDDVTTTQKDITFKYAIRHDVYQPYQPDFTIMSHTSSGGSGKETGP